MNSRKCDICKVDVHRASYVKHFSNKKHLGYEKRKEMIIPEWLFQEPIGNEIKKIYIPNSLKQIARDNIKLDDKNSAKKMINPYSITRRKVKN